MIDITTKTNHKQLYNNQMGQPVPHSLLFEIPKHVISILKKLPYLTKHIYNICIIPNIYKFIILEVCNVTVDEFKYIHNILHENIGNAISPTANSSIAVAKDSNHIHIVHASSHLGAYQSRSHLSRVILIRRLHWSFRREKSLRSM